MLVKAPLLLIASIVLMAILISLRLSDDTESSGISTSTFVAVVEGSNIKVLVTVRLSKFVAKSNLMILGLVVHFYLWLPKRSVGASTIRVTL